MNDTDLHSTSLTGCYVVAYYTQTFAKFRTFLLLQDEWDEEYELNSNKEPNV